MTVACTIRQWLLWARFCGMVHALYTHVKGFLWGGELSILKNVCPSPWICMPHIFLGCVGLHTCLLRICCFPFMLCSVGSALPPTPYSSKEHWCVCTYMHVCAHTCVCVGVYVGVGAFTRLYMYNIPVQLLFLSN